MLTIGIDMHGTLVPSDTEDVAAQHVGALIEAMRAARVKAGARLYLCTGNDFAYVRERLNPAVLSEFTGFVLECGCVVRSGSTTEVLVSPETTFSMRRLETELRNARLPGLRFFGHREAIVTAFNAWPDGDPSSKASAETLDLLASTVRSVVAEMNMECRVSVMKAGVAVDVVPVGHSKLTGLLFVAGSTDTFAIADSMNDADLLLGTDRALIPLDAQRDLIDHIRVSGREHIRHSANGVTEVVIEGLQMAVERT